MTWATAKQAADAIRDIMRDPHPSKFRKVFTADTLPRMVELLDPPPADDPVRDAAVGLLRATIEEYPGDPPHRYIAVNEGAPREAWWPALDALATAVSNAPPSQAHELRRIRMNMAQQGAQLMRLGAALQMARVWCFSDVELPDSAVMRRYLAGWIDNGQWPPFEWPREVPAVAKWLVDMGYSDIDGAIGVWITSNRTDPELGRDFAR